MVTHPPLGSPDFAMVAKGLVELHRLGKDGRDDSAEADSIRDALDAPLDSLNQAEKERAQWLSEDLYSISEPPPAIAQKAMTPQAQQQLDEALGLLRSGKWDKALELLRSLAEYITPSLLSNLRGRIWEEAGYPDVGAFFYEHASKGERWRPIPGPRDTKT